MLYTYYEYSSQGRNELVNEEIVYNALKTNRCINNIRKINKLVRVLFDAMPRSVSRFFAM